MKISSKVIFGYFLECHTIFEHDRVCAYVCACVRACVRACVCACTSAYACTRARVCVCLLNIERRRRLSSPVYLDGILTFSETVFISSNTNISCLYCVSAFVLCFMTGRAM